MMKRIQLGECNKLVEIRIWVVDDLYARQHVADHVLNPAEGWQSLVTVNVNVAKLSKHLETLRCARKEHAKSRCRAYQECDALLRELVPDYLRATEAAIDEGACAPRHTHNRPRSVGVRFEETCWFLSEAGVLAETFESFHLRTAYRLPNPIKRKQQTDKGYFYLAQEYVRTTRQKDVKELHSTSNWGVVTAMKDAFDRARRSSQGRKS